jgi:selenocysteine lyase/cysteine desulfurase
LLTPNIMDRRSFLNRSGMALGATLALPALAAKADEHINLDTWAGIRSQFKFVPGKIQMSQMLLASHPKWISDAIDMHRRKFDEDPTEYWEANWKTAEVKVCQAAAAYLKADPGEIVLTDSTTMGLTILYSGLKLKEGDEILTTTHDHYATEKSLEYATQKNKATIKRIALFKDPGIATVDEIVGNLAKSISSKTRVIAVTWVHSSSGMKLPIREMSDAVKTANAQRAAADRIYFCVDGVHGFGIENLNINELGCDFFAAGCHKWLFGPRGTGILWGRRDAWDMMMPTIPAFSEVSYGKWLGLFPEVKMSFSDLHTPGGFHSFEHRWALTEAFNFHIKTGKDKIEERTHQLSTQLKEGLREMKHVQLHTPVSTQLSAGINCFEVDGMKPEEVAAKLKEKNIIGNTSPYRISYARLTPCMINTEDEIKTCLNVIAKMKF